MNLLLINNDVEYYKLQLFFFSWKGLKVPTITKRCSILWF